MIEAALFGSQDRDSVLPPGLFKLIAGRWHETDVQEEWRKQKELREKNSANGKAGMDKRWAKKREGED